MLRVLACFGVVYNHVFGYRFFDVPGLGGILAQAAFYLTKTAVPLFFIISGVLLLSREDSYKKTIWRIARMALVLVGMSLFYYGMSCLRNGTPLQRKELLITIVQTGPANSYWFLYRYLSILVMLPILQRLVSWMEKRDFLYYLLATAFFGGLWPIVQHLFPVAPESPYLDLSAFCVYIGLMMAGVYPERYLTPSRKGCRLAAAGVSIGTAISVLLTQLSNGALVSGVLVYDNCAYLPISFAAVCIFYLCWCAGKGERLSKRTQLWSMALGRLTFCVYLFSDWIIDVLEPARDWLTANATPYGGTLLFAVLVYGCGLLLAAGLTRIPGLKRLL